MVETVQDRLIRLPEVMLLTSVSRSSIYEGMAKDTFPNSVKLGARSVAWRLSEVNQWINSRKTVMVGRCGNA